MRISTHLTSFRRYTFSITLLLTFSFAATSEASCPPGSSTTSGWERNTVVFYDVSSLPTTPTNIQAQAIAALNAWSDANGVNGSGVAFQPSNSSNPANLTFETGSTVLGGPAETEVHNVASNNTLLDHATITVDLGHEGFAANGSGYASALLKAFLHEIGHTMDIKPIIAPTLQQVVLTGTIMLWVAVNPTFQVPYSSI